MPLMPDCARPTRVTARVPLDDDLHACAARASAGLAGACVPEALKEAAVHDSDAWQAIRWHSGHGGTPEDKAREAAEEVAAYESRLSNVETRLVPGPEGRCYSRFGVLVDTHTVKFDDGAIEETRGRLFHRQRFTKWLGNAA